MSKKIVVWGNESAQVDKVAQEFRIQGNHVYSCVGESKETIQVVMKEEEQVDILVLCPSMKAEQDSKIGIMHDYTKIGDILEKNIIGAKQIVDEMLPMLRKSHIKRIALLTSKESSIRLNDRVDNYAWHMSLAALNMMMTIEFNILRDEGFTFRVFCIDDENVMDAYQYINASFSYHPKWQAKRSEENRIVMRNTRFEEVTW